MEFKNGQTVEYFKRNEMLQMISDLIGFCNDETTATITYKDGTTCTIDETGIDGDFHKTGIKSIVLDCGVYCVYGDVKIYDSITGKEYTEIDDHENACYIVA